MIPHIVYIGERVTATAYFVQPGTTNPVIPKDSNLYPVWRVLDPNQQFVAGGIGTYDDKAKCYQAQFQMPEFAEISASYNNPAVDTSNQQERPYLIEWEIVDISGKQWNMRECFTVGNPLFTTEVKEQQKLTLPQTSLPLSIPVVRNLNQDSQLQFKLYSFSSSSTIWTGIPHPDGSYGEYYIYSIEIPSGIMQEDEEYLGIWEFSDSPLGGRVQGEVLPKDDEISCTTYVDTTSGMPTGYPVQSTSRTIFTQVILCCGFIDMKLISDLRMYLDKVEKNLDIYQGWRDSDLYFHLKRGAELLNGFGLLSNWTIKDWKKNQMLRGGIYWLLEGAKLSALRAQYLAEGDSTFDFSGQPVSLSADRTGFIDSEIGRINDGLSNQFTQTKNQIIKSSIPVGHLHLQWPSVNPNMGFFNRASMGFSWPLPFGGLNLV